MKSDEFVRRLKEHLYEATVKAVTRGLVEAPGRRPGPLRARMSEFYNSLDAEGRQLLESIVRDSVHAGIFQFLCVLDGVCFIESEPTRGRFDLYYVKDADKTLLNNVSCELLHDVFNAEDSASHAA